MILKGNRQISAHLGKSRAQTTALVASGAIHRWTDDRGRMCMNVADADAWLARQAASAAPINTVRPPLADAIDHWENEGGPCIG